MEKFGQVQQSIRAEMYALVEQAKLGGPEPLATIALQGPSTHEGQLWPPTDHSTMQGSIGGDASGAPELLHHAGRELGDCCISVESLFSQRFVPEGRQRHRSASAGAATAQLRLAKRRELENEFQQMR